VRVKEVDASFAAANSTLSTVVIEVGRSETIKELRGDMAAWFTVDSVGNLQATWPLTLTIQNVDKTCYLD
jgi:hypothetical protein